MFGHRYFGARYFGPHYWGPGVGVVIPPVVPPISGVSEGTPAGSGKIAAGGKRKRRRDRSRPVHLHPRPRGIIKDPILELLEELTAPPVEAPPATAPSPVPASPARPWQFPVPKPQPPPPDMVRRPAPMDPALAAALALPPWQPVAVVDDDLMDWLAVMDSV